MSKVSKNRCAECDAHCCRHVALGIDTPRSIRDLDNIRWYLLHKDIWVSIDFEGKWLLEFRTPCRHIGDNYNCEIYENRPGICRNYPSDDELCEGETDEPSYAELFKCAEELDAFLKKHPATVKAVRKGYEKRKKDSIRKSLVY